MQACSVLLLQELVSLFSLQEVDAWSEVAENVCKYAIGRIQVKLRRIHIATLSNFFMDNVDSTSPMLLLSRLLLPV